MKNKTWRVHPLFASGLAFLFGGIITILPYFIYLGFLDPLGISFIMINTIVDIFGFGLVHFMYEIPKYFGGLFIVLGLAFSIVGFLKGFKPVATHSDKFSTEPFNGTSYTPEPSLVESESLVSTAVEESEKQNSPSTLESEHLGEIATTAEGQSGHTGDYNVADQLEKLASLVDKGYITKEEFDKEKSKLIK